MKLFLVRHGETDANRVLLHGVDTPMHDEPMAFKLGDDTNVPLNPNGRVHAWEAAQNLPDGITMILASPLLRTKETAEIICKEKGIDRKTIHFRDELLEYHQGKLEGLSKEQQFLVTGGVKKGSGLHCDYDFTDYGETHGKRSMTVSRSCSTNYAGKRLTHASFVSRAAG